MNCTKCNEKTSILIIVIKDKTCQNLCDKCFLSLDEKFKDIDQLDNVIVEAQELIKKFEQLSGKFEEPTIEDLDESIAQFAFTPSKSIMFAKTILLDLMRQKEVIRKKMNEHDKLSYNLKLALRNENYELASEIRDQINKSNSNEI
jgi:protein-arginine kinase activator protein McsA